MINFPYYSGNIKKSEALGLVDLDYFISSHRNPTKRTRDLIDKIKIESAKGDKKAKGLLKQQLHSFTPSVIINKGDKRRYDNIKEFTGLMQIDLDGIPTKQKAIDLKEHIFHSYEGIVCSYLSPSGLGIKALMKISKVGGHFIPREDAIKQYKALHQAVEKEFEQYEYFDHATSNAILPLFLSYDEDILSRQFEVAKTWAEEDWSRPKYVRLNTAPTHESRGDKQDKYYYDKVVRIIEKRINDILDNGHPQVRGTALVLGSRVAAGYITRDEAESLIEQLIMRNSYLQKGIKGYVKTALWAINEGIKQPKYF